MVALFHFTQCFQNNNVVDGHCQKLHFGVCTDIPANVQIAHDTVCIYFSCFFGECILAACDSRNKSWVKMVKY